MSLFRKPTKRIQRRVFGSGEDDEEGEPEPPPPPIISKEKKEKVTTKSLLSFADEEEDEETEAFKVKKSTQSKRLSKRREKEKNKASLGESKPEPMVVEEPTILTPAQKTEKPKKKVTLEGLILSGRAALAADSKGDLSDEEPEPELESRGFHMYRPETVRAALATPGHIPDAALIHAARKTRQQARELCGDFIPVRPENGVKGPGSRLVRDDGSDDEEEGRIAVHGLELPCDKPQRMEEVSDVEMDSEAEQWEEQQMQKAVPSLADIESVEINPFSQAPPPPRWDDAPPHLKQLEPQPTTPAQLVEALRTRLSELVTGRDVVTNRRAEVASRLVCAGRVRESRAARAAPLDAAYRRAQAARGYLTDLVECLDEKMPQLEALESRALLMHKRRCEFLQERRRADVRDQAQDVMSFGSKAGSSGGGKAAEEAVARAAEREGRRRARRLRRGGAPHTPGDSSDDELPPATGMHHQAERDAIRSLSASLFADVLSAWRGVRSVCARLTRLKRREPRLYSDAYLADCLPTLLAPYVRHQLILWNPLADEDNEDYEKMEWYKTIMLFGTRDERLSSDSECSDDEMGEVTTSEETLQDDPDLMLTPTIVQKVLVPKITELVEAAWDPLCIRACVSLRNILVRICSLPLANSNPPLKALAAAARGRLLAALASDVFLPPLPPTAQLTEGNAGAFWRRCLGSGVRLLRGILALCPPPDMLRADAIALQLIGTLCAGAGAAPGVFAGCACAALAKALPAHPATRATALAPLARLALRALSLLHKDNPLHMKAIEQARTVLAEARAAEVIE